MKIISIAALLAARLALMPAAFAAGEPVGETALDRDGAAGRQWKEKLALSAEQLPKFLAAVNAKDAELQPLREQLRANMRKLQGQLSGGAAEKDVQEVLEQLILTRKAIALRNDQFDGVMTSFLTPSQRAKLLVWRSLGAFPGKSAPALEADDFQDSTANGEVEPE